LTTVAVVILGLGIGATTAVFSLVNGLFLRLLPFPDPEQLVSIEASNVSGSTAVGPEDFGDWQSQGTAFQYMAYTFFAQATLTGQRLATTSEAERLTGSEVSADFFPMLNVKPLLGRWFVPEEQSPARNQVIILSYGNWVSRFGANNNILGQSLTLGGGSYTVVGIMPRTFRFNERRLCEYWVPLQHSAHGRTIHQYTAYGRLKPGVTIATAQAQLSAISKRLEQAFPASNTGWGVRVTSLGQQYRNEFAPTLTIFFVAAGLVLLIACANIANLLLAWATERAKEIAIRRALGASHLSLVRLLLTESLLLSLAGTLLGIFIAVWIEHVAAAVAPPWVELGSILYVDGNVFAFAVGLALVTAGLVGLVPALQTWRTDVNSSLKPGESRSGQGAGRVRALNVLVVCEVAMAALLLVSAGLLVESFGQLRGADLGFSTEKVLTVWISLPASRYPQPTQRAEFYRALVERVRDLPAVSSVGAVDAIPLSGKYTGGAFDIEGRPSPSNWTEQDGAYRTVTPEYFRTLNIRLLKGRYFSDADREGSTPVAIINEELARKFFSQGDSLGRKIRSTYSDRWLTIVGVVGDVRHNTPERPEGPAIYCPHAQTPDRQMFLAVLSDSSPTALAKAVRTEIRALDRELAPLQIRTLEQLVSESLSVRRQITLLTGICAAVAMVLAVLGISGVIWYGVSRRRHEIGVRMALGAKPENIVRLVLGRSFALTFAGLAIGLGTALICSRVMAAHLYGVSSRDPVVFLLVAMLLVFVAVGTSYLPARRAAAVDPMVALRHE
jgi:putative ABC transport system permease protein